MPVKLKTITENSWLVTGVTGGINIGLLTELRNQYTLMINGQKQKFLDKQSLTSYFNEDIFRSKIPDPISNTDIKYYVGGYPVSYENPVDAGISESGLPIFGKKASSDVYYCAGYYCLKYPNNWMPAFCPKLSTVSSYTYCGPFKTEEELKVMIDKLRQQDKNERNCAV